MEQYRICWQSKFTGFEGNGSWCNESGLEVLQREFKSAQKMYPDIDHWIESRDLDEQKAEQ